MPTENVLGTIATILTVALIWAIVAYRSNRAARSRAGTPLAGTPLPLVLGNAVACLALAFLLALLPATCSLRSDLTEARKDSAHWRSLAGHYSRQSAALQAALITCMDNSTRIGR